MTSRSFCREGLLIEAALRLALSHMATAAGKDHRLIAAALDLSPSQFSRAITTTPSDESHQRANFPADKIAAYIQESGDASYLLTLLDCLGYDPSRLAEIRRPVKTQAQLIEEQNAKLEAATKMIQEVLVLRMPEAGIKKEWRR